jgi:rhamnose transport system ATP-binding protein
VLIMDEPTASLSAHEVARLLSIARALKAQGVAVIYISHRLDEIFRIADRVTVIRDGQHISTRPSPRSPKTAWSATWSAARWNPLPSRPPPTRTGGDAVEVRGLGRAGVFRGIDFDLHKGEVLCLAGLVGARRTDVALALFGIAPATEGADRAGGQTGPSPSAARAPRWTWAWPMCPKTAASWALR